MGKLSKERDLKRSLDFVNSSCVDIIDLFNIMSGNSFELTSLTDVNPSNLKGLYLLIKGRDVVYVGQTTNIFRRLGQHLDDKEKRFKRYLFLSMVDFDQEELNRKESLLIRLFTPKYNQTHNDLTPIDFRLIKEKSYKTKKLIESYERRFVKNAYTYYNNSK